VTFRVDDLLVSVLPEHMAADKGCPKCSKCTNRTATPSPCDPNDPNSNNCATCIGASENDKTRRSQSWRDEQFELLSQELEEVLSR
jgi:hypothetical protein